MSTPDLTPILEDLAAGRIDAAEASRRIEELKAGGSSSNTPSGTSSPGTSSPDNSSPDNSSPDNSSPDNSSPGSSSSSAPPSGASAEAPGESGPGGSGGESKPAEPGWQTYARETFARIAEQAGFADSSKQDPPKPEPQDPPKRSGGSASFEEGTDEVPAAERRTNQAKGVDRVSIRAVGRRVRVAGDPKVATVSIDGAHVLRRSGSVLEISSDGELGPSIDGFTLLRPPRNLDDVRNLGLGKELFIRVNPNLIVDVELTAGSLTTEDVRFLGKVRVTAGGAKLTGVNEAHDVLVQAGQATVVGRVTTGRSRIRCESGSLNVQLDDASNVTVRAEAQLGRVVWAGGHSGAGDEVVMGNGAARLDVGVVMGHAAVRVGAEKEEAR